MAANYAPATAALAPQTQQQPIPLASLAGLFGTPQPAQQQAPLQSLAELSTIRRYLGKGQVQPLLDMAEGDSDIAKIQREMERQGLYTGSPQFSQPSIEPLRMTPK